MKNSYLLVTLLLSAISSSAWADSACTVDRDHLGASYVISTVHDQAATKQRRVTIWRLPTKVAWEYSGSGVTEVWARAADGRLYVSRYFDEYQRGIEYQPEEVRITQADAWERQRHLLSSEQLAAFARGDSSGEGCDRQTLLTLQGQGADEEIHWLDALALPRTWEQQEGPVQYRWSLESLVVDPARVEEAFARRESYQMTDYADIGDNESDPFLRRMINLGFVSHGASGFYNAHGEAMDGHGHSH